MIKVLVTAEDNKGFVGSMSKTCKDWDEAVKEATPLVKACNETYDGKVLSVIFEFIGE